MLRPTRVLSPCNLPFDAISPHRGVPPRRPPSLPHTARAGGAVYRPERRDLRSGHLHDDRSPVPDSSTAQCSSGAGAGGGATQQGKQGKTPNKCSLPLTAKESLAVTDVTMRTRASSLSGRTIETGVWTIPGRPNTPVPTKRASFFSLGRASFGVPAGAESLVHYHPSYGTVWDNDYGSLSRDDTLYANAFGLKRIIAASRDSLSLWGNGGRIRTCPR